MSLPFPNDGVVPGAFRPTHLAIHYNEVALKGRNRPWFEDRLVRNVRAALGMVGREGAQVARAYGRLLLDLAPGGAAPADDRLASVLGRVFGIAYVLPVLRIEPRLEAIQEAAERSVDAAGDVRTFAVKCRRSTKEFPFGSMDVQREVGATVQRKTGWKVDLQHADCTLRIDCVSGSVFLGFRRLPGPGGLPTGVAGKVACLISGGIDSPVAAHRLLRRGATAVYVHFHSYPHTGVESQEKVVELASRVQPPGFGATMYLVPFAELQRKISARCAAPLRILLYRRFMFRVAEVLGRREGALALVTGENLGQVASQTLENLQAIDAVARLPVLRPLVGLDKLEIIAEAQEIGTFDTSIEPHGDCCSFLQPPNPATHSTPEDLDAAESRLDVSAEVDALVAAARQIQVEPRRP